MINHNRISARVVLFERNTIGFSHGDVSFDDVRVSSYQYLREANIAAKLGIINETLDFVSLLFVHAIRFCFSYLLRSGLIRIFVIPTSSINL